MFDQLYMQHSTHAVFDSIMTKEVDDTKTWSVLLNSRPFRIGGHVVIQSGSGGSWSENGSDCGNGVCL